MRLVANTAMAFTAVIFAASASAEQAVQPATDQVPIEVKGKKKIPDPNEVVCEKEQDTGSRLMSHQVCMTRSQWTEQRRLERMDIDKAQIERPMQN